ncbi:MAG: DUF5597 domain-containing protein [Acidobacteriaceae bacterium]
MKRQLSSACLGVLLAAAVAAVAQEMPAVRMENGASQFLVQGKPFLMLAGELGNSSAGTAAEADTILPRLAALHFNTVLMPVAWDEIEPQEGQFDFSIPDHWIEVARREHIHLVFLWFGSWKNAFSEYAPAWVMANAQRFPREISAEGMPLGILSPLGEETMQCDARAFAALMRHVKETDAAQQTVLMVQVENEIGFLGVGGRDRSEAANRLFAGPVPAELLRALQADRARLPYAMDKEFNPAGKTWQAAFGNAADEVFMAWEYGRFANTVAAAGKKEYALPVYMNAQLPAPLEQPGSYPSGGPYPRDQVIYRVAAPAIDFYSPDIYWPDFENWIEKYRDQGNPVFVPEARLDQAPFNALYTFGEGRGFGFSPFAVDSLPAQAPADDKGPDLSDEYAALSEMSDALISAQAKNQTRALVLHATSWRPTQTVALGGYLFRASLARSWPAMTPEETDGAMLVIESGTNEFTVMGSGLRVEFLRDPDMDNQAAGIAGIEQMAYTDGKWTVARELNGDQSDQGRALLMDAHAFRVYRLRLYAVPRGQAKP